MEDVKDDNVVENLQEDSCYQGIISTPNNRQHTQHPQNGYYMNDWYEWQGKNKK